ncbi:hypothetical protein MRX96_022431 [Rhipicephalus microplus]
MTLRKYLQTLGAQLYFSEPRCSDVQIRPGTDVAVSNENLDAARKYVDTVVRRLRRNILAQGADTANESANDGRPWPLKEPSDDDVGSPQRYDVSAVVLLQDVYFEASYTYTSAAQTASGTITGKIATVRLDVIIGHPKSQDGVPEVNVFEVTEYSCVRLPKKSVGVLNEKVIKEVTENIVHTCIEDALSSRVLPMLNNLLKAIPYPHFT